MSNCAAAELPLRRMTPKVFAGSAATIALSAEAPLTQSTRLPATSVARTAATDADGTTPVVIVLIPSWPRIATLIVVLPAASTLLTGAA